MALGQFGSGGTNWLDAINKGLSTIGQVANIANLFKKQPQTGTGLTTSGLNLGGVQIPSSVLGAGLTLAAPYAEREPGYAVEARQAIRNNLTPEQQVGQFGSYLSQLGQNNPYQALLDQTRRRDIADIQQRFTAAFPANAGAQGPEFGSLARYITDEALPREQAQMGDLAQSFMNRQLQSGQSLLNYAKPSGLSEALGQLGGMLMLKDLYGGQAGAGRPVVGTDGASLTQGPQGLSQLLSQGGQVLGTVNSLGQLSKALNTTLGFDAAMSGQGLSGLTALNSYGVPIPVEAISGGGLGQVGQGGATAAGTAGIPGVRGLMSGQGFLGAPSLSSAGGVASGVGAAGVGYAVGNAMGSQIDKPGTQIGDIAKYATPLGFTRNEGLQAAGAGAATGAAAGFMVGGPVGAVIGAIAGGIGGFTGERKARIERKEGQIAQETAETAQARPQALAALQQGSQTAAQSVQQLDAMLQNPQAVASVAQAIQTIPAAQQIYQAAFNEQATSRGSFLERSVPPDQWLAKMRQYIASRLGSISDPKSLIVQQIQGSTERGNFFPAVAQSQSLTDDLVKAIQLVNQMLAVTGGA